MNYHPALRRSSVSLAVLGIALASSPALAQSADEAASEGRDDTIIVTAARTILPPNALPLTIDIIGKQELDQQIAMSGSITDAVSSLTPSFSPTRGKLSGSGETLRGQIGAQADGRVGPAAAQHLGRVECLPVFGKGSV